MRRTCSPLLSAITIATLFAATPTFFSCGLARRGNGAMVAAAQNVVTQRNNNARTGLYSDQTLKPSNISPSTFGKLFSLLVEGSIFAQPLYLSSKNIKGERHNVVYVATMANMVYAFDADVDGAPLWKRDLGPPVELQAPCFGYTAYRDVAVQIGITGTPVIAQSEKSPLYLISITQSPPETNQDEATDPTPYTFTYTLHMLDPLTGETINRNDFATSECVNGTTISNSGPFAPNLQNQRPGLLHFQGRVYAAFAGYNDRSPFNGWVLGFDEDTLELNAEFNTTYPQGGGGIWMSGQGIVADSDSLYVMTGNGYYRTGVSLSQSFIKLTPDLELVDWFTPCNLFCLNADDLDLASGGATLLPDDLWPGKQLIVGGGKEGKLYLLDRQEMGKFARDERHILQSLCVGGHCGSCGHPHGIGGSKTPTCAPTGENPSPNYGIRGTPAYWDGPVSAATGGSNPHIYVWPQRNRLQAYKFNESNEKFTIAAYGDGPDAPTNPGGILAISANGQSDGVLWAVTVRPGATSANQHVVPGVLRAYGIELDQQTSAVTLRQRWNSDSNPADMLGNFPKFPPPVIANGKVYMATMGSVKTLGKPPNPAQLVVYGLKPR